MVSIWPKAIAVATNASASVPRIPFHATRKPLIAEVIRKPRPDTMPTSPLALSRSSGGINAVTSVGSAIILRLPAITPSIAMPVKTHKGALSTCDRAAGGAISTTPRATA